MSRTVVIILALIVACIVASMIVLFMTDPFIKPDDKRLTAREEMLVIIIFITGIIALVSLSYNVMSIDSLIKIIF